MSDLIRIGCSCGHQHSTREPYVVGLVIPCEDPDCECTLVVEEIK